MNLSRPSLIFAGISLFVLITSVQARDTSLASGQFVGFYNQYSMQESIARALSYDPEYLAAVAGRDAGIENESIAFSALLPSISATYSIFPDSTTDLRTTASGLSTPWSRLSYESASRSVQLRQPIFRLKNWAAYLQGKSQAEQAEARLKFARYQAVNRILTLHVDWLTAEKRLEFARAALKTATRRTEQIQAMQQNNMATVVEFFQARAEEQKAIRDESESRKEFEYIASRYSQIIDDRNGRPANFILETLLFGVERQSKQAELEVIALSSNPELAALRHGIEVAASDLRKNRADHLPTVDLIAQYIEDNNTTAVVLGRETRTTAIGIQATIPLFQGGGVNAAIRQSSANLRRAQAEFDLGKQRVFNDLQRTSFAIQSANKGIRFGAQQVEYALKNLKAIQEKRKYGLASDIEELQADQLMTASQFEVQAAYAQKINAASFLKALLGELEKIEANPNLLLSE